MLKEIWDAVTPYLPAKIVLAILGIVSIAYVTVKVKAIWDRFTAVETKVEAHEAIGKGIVRIDKHLTMLLTHFIAKREIDPALLQSASPLRVTPLGDQLLKDSGFVTVFPSIRAKVVEQISMLQPHTKLDVENAAVQALFYLLGEPEMTPFKNWMYEHPQYKATDTVTVTSNELLTTAGVYARDRILEDNDLMQKWGIS